jgi:hypothetical protein
MYPVWIYTDVNQNQKEISYVKAHRTILMAFVVLILSITGCNMPSNKGSTTPDAYEAAALTVTALAGTEQSGLPTPSLTAVPTFAMPTPAGTNTAVPLPASPAAQASATPGGSLFAVDVGANCRLGPGTNYDKVASFAPGAYLGLAGRNSDRSWWVVKTGNITCWISATTGHTSGPLDTIPVVQAPPLPTGAVTAYP